MTSQVIAVGPEADIGEVIELLIEHKIGALPVVQEETREVLGIISYVDVLRALQGVLDED
jgi:acetoin utilization protein AcuB